MADTQNSTPVENLDAPKKAVEKPKPRMYTVKKFAVDKDGNQIDGGTVSVPLRDRVRTEFVGGKPVDYPDPVKFVRDYGIKNQDGSPSYVEFGENFFEEQCPTGNPTHDVSKLSGSIHRCVYCHTPIPAK